jgi:lantibiotic modifying enzyme
MNIDKKINNELPVWNILNKINIHLCNYISMENEIKNSGSYGIYNGHFGLLLYLAIYNKHFPDKKLGKLIDSFADRLISEWSENPYNYTYCSGMSGIMDMFSYMNEKKIYSVDLKAVLPPLENYMANRMIDDIMKGKYDFLHGAMGAAYYLMNENRKISYIEQFISYLEECAEKDDGVYKWKFFDMTDTQFKYNIGLAHGMSSIVIFLSEAYNKNICKDLIRQLLPGAVSFILEQKYNFETRNYSLFPSLSKEDETTESRLGWCYGDLGIAVALWKAGNCLNISEYESIAVDIVENTMNRTNLEANMIRDAGICHGTAGLVMMFQYFGEKMKWDKALNLKDYWLLETLKKICPYNEDIDISTACENNEYSLLTGISGIGLVLLSSAIQDFTWKKLFLLT